MNIQLFNPKLSPKYSPNLFKWLNKHKHLSSRIGVFKSIENSCLYIGFADDLCMNGTRITQVLCNGAKSQGWAHPLKDFELVEGFWDEYQAKGRCAIDPKHVVSFIGDKTRWHVEGNKRTCLWCGNCDQVLVKRARKYVEERWEKAAA